MPHAKTTVAVLQPGYLPWLGFFDQMDRADVFVFYDDVQYDKHGWRNRNRIKTTQGVRWLTVPVRHAGLDRPRLLDVEIDNRSAWARKHVTTLRQSYARAPFTGDVLPAIEAILERPWERLADLDVALAGTMAAMLGITTRLVRSSELGVEGERSERLLRICQHFGAGRYVSGSAAREYLDVALFERHGVMVEWQDYEHPEYPQQHGAFVPFLSAVDLMLNCGPESLEIVRRRPLPETARRTQTS